MARSSAGRGLCRVSHPGIFEQPIVTHRHSGQRLLLEPSRLKWNHLRRDAAWARLIREARRVRPEHSRSSCTALAFLRSQASKLFPSTLRTSSSSSAPWPSPPPTEKTGWLDCFATPWISTGYWSWRRWPWPTDARSEASRLDWRTRACHQDRPVGEVDAVLGGAETERITAPPTVRRDLRNAWSRQR
jgi:hypothetical protein